MGQILAAFARYCKFLQCRPLDFVNMYFYRIAFGSGSMSRLNIDLGYAATIGTVTFLFILLFTSVMNFALGKVKVWNE